MNFDVDFKEKDIELQADFDEKGVELQADFGNKIELKHLIVQSMAVKKVYAASNSSTEAPTEWEDEAPTLTTDKPYLWMKTHTTYTVEDGTTYNFADNGIVVGGIGAKGEDGKTAYEYAQDGGYTGTEEEFAEKLAKGYSGVTVADYGAKGDGSTDDTTAFQTALTENRVVFVPGGDYVLSDTLIIRANCCLELSQDTVLRFKQTDRHGITMLRLANLKSNHATIFVPYTFSANVINCDGGDDYAQLDLDNTATSNALAVPPFKKWDPQWKTSRYVTDINICKVTETGTTGTSNFHYSLDGTCYGNAIYIHCDETDYPCNYMWGVSMSGVRIAGGFNCGIHIHNIGDPKVAWNHDMRIEAVIDACKIGVLVENARYDRLAVTIQPRPALNGTAYAENGIKLVDSRGIDLTSSRVWDWMTKDDNGNTINSKWEKGNQYQHIAMYGDCTGLLLDDYLYHAQSTYDIRDLIYTDTASNLDKMSILQEPVTRWFKPVDGKPYFVDGSSEKPLATQEEVDRYFNTDVVKNFTDVLVTATDTDGTACGGVGYKKGYLGGDGAVVSSELYIVTGFIPCAVGQTLYVEGMSFKTYDNSCNLCVFDANKKFIRYVSGANLTTGNMWYVGYTETDNGFTTTVNNVVGNENASYIRFSVKKDNVGGNPMAALNEEIKYTVEGFLADGVKVKGDKVILTNPSGKTFTLSVNDNGELSTTPIS